MTIICFDGEFTDAVRQLPRHVEPEARDKVYREYGIPENVLECVIEWNRRYTPQMTACVGME